MTDLEMWSLIVGWLLPVLIAFINRFTTWDRTARAIIAFGVCAAASAVTVWAQGDLNAERWFRSLLLVTIATMATYQSFWKPTRVAPAIEGRMPPAQPTGALR